MRPSNDRFQGCRAAVHHLLGRRETLRVGGLGLLSVGPTDLLLQSPVTGHPSVIRLR
jgi:hypothetical protein